MFFLVQSRISLNLTARVRDVTGHVFLCSVNFLRLPISREAALAKAAGNIVLPLRLICVFCALRVLHLLCFADCNVNVFLTPSPFFFLLSTEVFAVGLTGGFCAFVSALRQQPKC